MGCLVMYGEVEYSGDRVVIAACDGSGKVLCCRTTGLYLELTELSVPGKEALS